MQVLNLDDLPEFARRELLDFHQFLRQKYSLKNKEIKGESNAPLAPRLVKPFKPMSRETLYDR